MSIPDESKGLRFACECVSAAEGGYSEPWAAIAKNKLLPNGTKEEILNLLAHEPGTISQLAEKLGLSAPSVHAHVSDMIKSQLLREATEWEKTHPAERYYEPNFPIIRAEERAEFETLCREMAEQMADLFARQQPRLEQALSKTSLPERGWSFADVAQYLYASAQRSARELLEARGTLPRAPAQREIGKWVFWAEEPEAETKL